MQIIPAIDIFEKQCVRLTRGVFSELTDYGLDPGFVAERFITEGATYLHVVDLEGARKGCVVNWESIEAVASAASGRLEVGGGVRTDREIDRLLSLGIDRVVLGSIALKAPETLRLWVKRYGGDRICAALDVKDNGIAYAAWQKVDRRNIHDGVKIFIDAGVHAVLSTDITRDGLMAGPNLELYSGLVKAYPSLEWIASGGVRSKGDLDVLRMTGVHGVVIGKALYEGHGTLKDYLAGSC